MKNVKIQRKLQPKYCMQLNSLFRQVAKFSHLSRTSEHYVQNHRNPTHLGNVKDTWVAPFDNMKGS